jgi:hypothetical protein
VNKTLSPGAAAIDPVSSAATVESGKSVAVTARLVRG